MTIYSRGPKTPPRRDGGKADVHFCTSLHPCVDVILCLPFLLLPSVFRAILGKTGLEGKVQPYQAKKKWDNLKIYI